MRVLMLKHKNIKLVFFCSVFAIVTHVFSLYYPMLAKETADPNDLSPLGGVCIAIDPGHGGIDDGASRRTVIEKDLNLSIALKLAEILNTAGANVVLTRDSDVDYYTKGKGGKRNDLLKRIEIIQNANPRLYVSIHANAMSNAKWTGAQVFFNPSNPESKQLAETVQDFLRDFPPGNKRKAKQDLDILVLNRTGIPGVLVETGYISNTEEALKLTSPQYQQEIALQIARALAYHLRNNAGR